VVAVGFDRFAPGRTQDVGLSGDGPPALFIVVRLAHHSPTAASDWLAGIMTVIFVQRGRVCKSPTCRVGAKQ
jgi:hypothetical protein